MAISKEERNGRFRYKAQISGYGNKRLNGKWRRTIEEAKNDEKEMIEERDSFKLTEQYINNSKSKYVKICHVTQIKTLLESYLDIFCKQDLPDNIRIDITKMMLIDMRKIEETINKERTKC